MVPVGRTRTVFPHMIIHKATHSQRSPVPVSPLPIRLPLPTWGAKTHLALSWTTAKVILNTTMCKSNPQRMQCASPWLGKGRSTGPGSQDRSLLTAGSWGMGRQHYVNAMWGCYYVFLSQHNYQYIPFHFQRPPWMVNSMVTHLTHAMSVFCSAFQHYTFKHVLEHFLYIGTHLKIKNGWMLLW